MSKLGTKKTIIAATVSSAMAFAMATGVVAVESEQHLELSSKGIESFMIDSGAGSLEVMGEKGLDKILVEANVIVEKIDDDEAKEFFEDNLVLTLTQKRGKATLKAKVKEQSFFNTWNNEYRIDLTVRMPESLSLSIDDGSGHTSITNIQAPLNVDDGSGHLTISNIGGDTWIDDGSGHLTISDIAGTLTIDDGSGNLTISAVEKKVSIDDGSGGITINGVTSDVYVNDGSGSVNICNVKGDLSIDEKKNIETCNIEGKITLR